MEKLDKKPKNPINELTKKKVEDYEALTKDIDRLVEYIKPIVGEDNDIVNKLVSRIRFRVMMLPMTDLIQITLQSSMGIFMAGKEFKKHQEEFNKIFKEGADHKDFEKFVRGDK